MTAEFISSAAGVSVSLIVALFVFATLMDIDFSTRMVLYLTAAGMAMLALILVLRLLGA